ncbi:glyceraldehyde-3-phosphate dehydrogenase [Roseibacterium sp. SDUM158017]|nr:glyceraldehyde-3-phosphate dehydrogenase [Roseibacterium sp. SDUM158017]MDG4650003.1 glyceraldehyde-3-phosphate dehydrogenase [Roseibacterium sp. SDUM158017]
MTNTVAAWLAAILLAGALADLALNDGQVLFFLALRLARVIEWMAFWR